MFAICQLTVERPPGKTDRYGIMSHATPPAQSNSNPYETGIVTSDEHLGSSYVRFSTSFRFAIVLTGGLFLAIVFTRNVFKDMYGGFHVDVPSATLVALSSGTLVLVCSLFLFTLAKEFFCPSGSLVRDFNGFACLAALVVGLAYTIAVFLPFIGPLMH